jgi:glycosyltransferase involved in cell wall biosynthesis
MRITFFCSSLESGRDGVGDYTRRLSEEMFRHGHQPLIVALYDRHISQVFDSHHETPNDPIRTLRFPASFPWSRRSCAVRDLVIGFDPEWASLQFVPYGFHDKGIDWNLGRNLRQFMSDRRVHVMFHEIWIGAYRDARLKERLIGKLQRMCIRRMVRHISPVVVTTSNEPYGALLRGAGISSQLLPLFGNIPVAGKRRSSWLDGAMKINDREAHWVFALFGTLHLIWPPEPLFSYLAKAAKHAGKRVIIACIGRLGPGESLWNRLGCEYGNALRFVHLGEQPAERISEFLHAADFGIAASPWELIGKSGTVASMLEHGLPVIVNRDDVRFTATERTRSSSSLLIKMDENLPSRLLSVRRENSKPISSEIAQLMLSYLGYVGGAMHSNGAAQRPERPSSPVPI